MHISKNTQKRVCLNTRLNTRDIFMDGIFLLTLH